ncbi:uncharacterized protein LOC103720975 [Phoenix dactylifera]|uniref:Uncharacterized protein LOC103720975 n=1 Tax=Phoenix dactylifera TaxID=42345 RepID=A0A8B7CYL0_PHODC|nr:uncharacterized protein LOC103720975 [Phoenix dactylifera]XP_008809184.1 uncharacterized protein LOC103720975 [Phoenix dactylifera]XP_038973319.1 uncharacterized protein LOC103720975 [Phoenix dactylifera]
MAVSDPELVSSGNILEMEIIILIKRVHHMIESCLQRYMTKEEVVKELKEKALIEPCLVDLVWRRLEEENPEFFSGYYGRLTLRKQITMFKQLPERQCYLMEQSHQEELQNNNHHTTGSQVVHEVMPPRSSQYNLMNSLDGIDKNNAVNSQTEGFPNMSSSVSEMGVGSSFMASSSHFPLHPNSSAEEVSQNREGSELEPARRDI